MSPNTVPKSCKFRLEDIESILSSREVSSEPEANVHDETIETNEGADADSALLFAPRYGGQESVLKPLCEQALKKGLNRCVWLCFPHHRTVTTKHVPLLVDAGQDGATEVFDLRKQLKWKDRYSLYSVIGVTEVEVCQPFQVLCSTDIRKDEHHTNQPELD